MTQIYRIALSPDDYNPPQPVYTHVCRASIGKCTVETRHYSAEDAQREAAWHERYGEQAEVERCN